MENLGYSEMSADAINALYEEARMVIEGSTPERAVEMLEDVLAALAVTHQVDDEIMIEVRMYLGRALWLSRLAERAVTILRPAWVDAVRVAGRVSRLAFSCSGNLCRALGDCGEFEEAFAIAIEAYDLREAEYGELDNGTLNSLGHIAHLQYDAGFLVEAVETMTELLARRTEAFGVHDSRTESSRYNLTVMKARLENRHDGVAGETIEHYAELYGEYSAPVVNLHAQLAAILERNGQLEDALAEWSYVERMRAELHGEVAIPTLTASARKLWVIRQLGDVRVDAQLKSIGHTVERIAGPDHPLAQWCAELVSPR
jgi:tetratricopeptide (TPR) repeat protein